MKIQPTCLIVEGGGFKTGFTTGILDAFLVSQYRPFDRYIGISGGAVAVSYFLSRQYRYMLNSMLLLAQDKNFTNFKRTFGAEGYMDVDAFARVAEREVPFHLEKAVREISKTPTHFVATNRQQGTPAYLSPTKETWIDAIVASCALPFVTKGKHLLNGAEYFDGGWSDPLPVQWAYEQGATKILLLRTWPLGVRSVQSWMDYFGSLYYSSEPALKQCFEQCHQNYNASLEFIADPPAGLQIDQITPTKLLKSTTHSYTKQTIMRDYRYGLDKGLKYIVGKNT